jgi:2-keto-3-deoxy-L-arabinonate dehydratase
VIRSAALRRPLAPIHSATREGLLRVARRLDPLVLRWGH